MTRTLTGLYDDYADAEAAVRDLEAAGIRDADISLFARDSGTIAKREVKEGNESGTGAGAGAAFGAIVGGGSGLLAGLGMLAIPGIGPVVAAGWLVAAAAGAVGGAVVGGAGGGLIGAMIGNGVPEQDAHVYAEGVRRGGTLVSVRVEEAQAGTVYAILRRHRAVDPAERRRIYGKMGWTSFDENAPAYTDAEFERERRARTSTLV
jgi:hypothetical protein